jgi:hypothetical protein
VEVSSPISDFYSRLRHDYPLHNDANAKNVKTIVVGMIVCVKRNHIVIRKFIMIGIKNVVVLRRR